MLCRTCSGGRSLQLSQVSGKDFALASAACVAVALAGGWILGAIGGRIGIFVLWCGFLDGLAIAQIALRLTNRQRGQPMEIMVAAVAAAGIVLGAALYQHGMVVFSQPNLLWNMLHDGWIISSLIIASASGVMKIHYL